MEVLKTNESLRAAVQKLQSEIDALETVLMTDFENVESKVQDPISAMYDEKRLSLKNLLQKREWTFGFVGGGWNSILAHTEEEAIMFAMDKYGTVVDEKSFRIATHKETNFLLASFY